MYRSITCSLLCFLFLTGLLSAERLIAQNPPVESAVSEIPDGKSLTITILDESGKPIPKAKFSYAGNPKLHEGTGYRKYTETDENGRYVIRHSLDKPQKTLNVYIEPSGYDFYLAAWGDRSGDVENDPIPAEFSVKLEKAATVGGIVLGDDGKPLANVSVEFTMPWGKRSRVKQPDYFVHAARTKTSENGVWKYESVPLDQLESNVRITFEHPDYMKTVKQLNLSGIVPAAEGTFAQSVRLERGITVKGRVIDTEGKPVAGVVVIGQCEEYGGAIKTDTNENGEYTFKNWTESRSAYVGVWKAGMMAALKSFPVEKDSSPVIDFTMKPAGKPVTIKIVNKGGEPIKGFYLAIERWGNRRMPGDALLTGKDRPRTDENGRWIWKEAPDEEVILYMFLNDKHMDVRNKSVVPRDEEYVFVSEAPLNITGKVTDSETGKAMPKFNVYWGQKFPNNPQFYWEIKQGAGANGTYRVGTNYPMEAEVAVKVEAEGYEPVVSRSISLNEGSITLDFALKKLSAEKAKGIFGMVLQPDGKPAADVSVAMATHGNGRPYIQNGRLNREEEPYTVSTDKEGRFKFKYIDFEEESKDRPHFSPEIQKVNYLLVFLHDSGFKRITQQEWEALDENKTVTLETWGRVEGIVKVGTKPGKNLPVQSWVSFSEDSNAYRNEPHLMMYYETIADESGKFVINRLPASFVRVGRKIEFGNSSTASAATDKIQLKPGETATVALGGVGRPVTGKLVPSKEFDTPPDWTFAHIQCTPVMENVEFPRAAWEELRAKMEPKELLEGNDPTKRAEWLETEDGKKLKAAYDELTVDYRAAEERNDAKRTKRRVCAVAKDGTFRLDDIPEGDWMLKVQLDSPPPTTDSCGTGGQIGTLEYNFSVAA
ncbi:MAG: carboxypeptidase-like regulatory domain-containing protein, partial [Planctomycetaceae bacterium]|nr:carboxypeptidase-like regulatory domain-containing protein [Planctomycetaceae bacterium]